VRLGVKPEINAICTVMVSAVALMVIAASLVARLTDTRATKAAIAP